MERFYERKEIKKRVKEKEESKTRGVFITAKGRLKGISRTRKLKLKKGRTGSINVIENKIGIKTKWGIIGITVSRNIARLPRH